MKPRIALIAATIVLFAGTALAQEIKKAPAPYTTPASGKDMYMAYCASCHGQDAKGKGPAAPALKVAPPDLTLLARHNGGKYPELRVYSFIQGETMLPAHGSKEMPVWGPVFRSLDARDKGVVHLRITNLTRYIESLQVK